MSFLKTALVAFLAITAGGFAHARPVAPGGCGIGNPYDPQCTGVCSTLGPRFVHECCAYKILHEFDDASCRAPAPAPAIAPPGSTCASTGPANAAACCARKASEGVHDPTCPAPSPSPLPPSPSPLPPSPSPPPPSPSPLPPSPSPSPLPPSPSPSPPPPSPSPSPPPPSPSPSPPPPSPSPPPPSPTPAPAVGTDCASRGPVYAAACCAVKASKGVADDSCPSPAPMCPCPAAPPADVNLTDLAATSAKGQFTFPDGAWKNVESFTVAPGLEFVGCDGLVVTRNGSESLEDCQRFATSLRFARALTWDDKTETCQPYESLSGADGAADDAPLVYVWDHELVPANATIPGACARNATVRGAPAFVHY